MILRYPFFQGNVAEHSGLILIVSAHETIIARNVPLEKALHSVFFNKFLEAMTGRRTAAPEPVARQRHIDASAIVEVDAISTEAVMRLTGLLSAALTARRDGDAPLRHGDHL
jgi:hypothetical protein